MDSAKATVSEWRNRLIELRHAGHYDDICPGPLRSIDCERLAHLNETTLHNKQIDGATQWSARSDPAETGTSKSSVQRCFQLFGLQPHRTEGSSLSTYPFFVEKLRDVVGLHLGPPVNALVMFAVTSDTTALDSIFHNAD